MWEKEEFIRDFNTQKIIGIIRYCTNGDQEAVDFLTQKVLGYYRKQLDHTTDFFGRVVSKGNTVLRFLYDKH